MKALITIGFAIAFALLFDSIAHAAPAYGPQLDPTAATPLDAAVSTRVRGSLPPELVLVALHAPMSWNVGDADALAVEWRTPPHPGQLTVQLKLDAADGSHKIGWAQVTLRGMRAVLVTKRALSKDEVLGPDDVQLEAKPVADGEGVSIEPRALSGQSLLRDVPAGEVLSAADVVMPAPVARGAELTVLVKHGPLTISTHGVVERAARPGERSAARVDEGRRLVFGRLIDSDTLLVEDK